MRHTIPTFRLLPIRHLLALLLLLSALHGAAQDRVPRRERIAAHRQMLWDARHDPHKWDRMPLWSAGFGYAMGYPAQSTFDGQLGEVGSTTRGTYSLGAGRRLQKGWFVAASVQHDQLRTAGTTNTVLLQSWGNGIFFGTTTAQYQADFVTVRHDVTSLDLMTGVFNAPFPRRKKVGLTFSSAAGLSVLGVRGEHGIERRGTYTTTYGFLDGLFGEPDRAHAMGHWNSRQVCDTQVAMGLSMLLDFRVELWVGRHLSLVLTSLRLDMPLVKPHFNAVSDAEGQVLGAYDLDLFAVRFGTGLVVHF